MKAIVVPEQAANGRDASRLIAHSLVKSCSGSGWIRTNISQLADLDDAVFDFNTSRRVKGKTIIRIRS